MRRAEQVFVAQGQNVQSYVPDPAIKDVLMREVLGRSGNLRAPTVQVGNTYYVGYNETMYKELTV